jgi:thiamine pyrophosphate-dependent acetolactate synthase large subunit-like protein
MNLRHEYLSALVSELTDEIIVTNSGGTQHELFSLADRDANFYATGIGLASPVALGLAIALPNRKIIALDGDGSLLLNLGILPVLADERPQNLTILVFDNGLYESGG